MSQFANLSLSTIRKILTERNKLAKIVRNLVWLGFESILRLGSGLAMTIWLARYLGPQQFGLLSYSVALVALMTPLATLGLGNIVVRDLVQRPECSGQLLGTTFCLRLVASVVTALSVLLLAKILAVGSTIFVLVSLLSIGIGLRSFDTITYWFQAQVESKYVVYAKNCALLLTTLLQVILILQQAPLVFFAASTVAELVMAAIGLVIVYQCYGAGFQTWRFRWQFARTLLHQGWPLIFSSLAITLYMKVDQLMLGNIVGETAVGIYAAATRISEASYFIPTIVVSSIAPALIEAKQKSLELYHQRLQQLFSVMVGLGCAIAIPTTLLAQPLITVLYSSDYLTSVPVLRFHIWASIFVFLGLAQGIWDVNENLQQLAFIKIFAGCLLNILLNLWLIPTCGVMGATIATMVSYLIVNYLANAVHPKTNSIFCLQSRAFLLVQLWPSRH